MREWELQLAADADGKLIVWRSASLGTDQRATVTANTGHFEGTLAGRDQLDGNALYYCRLRERGQESEWSQWSPWHQGFRTER